MNEIQFDNVIEILKHSGFGLPSLNCCNTEEELLHRLFESSINRKEFLQWAISQLSDNYAADIQNCEDVNVEIVRKLKVLGYDEKSSEWNFLKGRMEKCDQRKIYKKLFETVVLIRNADSTTSLCEKNDARKEEISYDKHLLQSLKLISSVNNKNKQHQGFDLAQARERLKVCDDILERSQKIKESGIKERADAEINSIAKLNTSDDVKTTIDPCMPLSFSIKQVLDMLPVKPSVVELDATVVGELHNSLQHLSNETKQ